MDTSYPHPNELIYEITLPHLGITPNELTQRTGFDGTWPIDEETDRLLCEVTDNSPGYWLAVWEGYEWVMDSNAGQAALEEHLRSGLPTSPLEDVAKELGIDL